MNSIRNKAFFKDKKFLVAGITVLVFAVLGAFLLQRSMASSGLTPTASCGARVANYNYQRPFGADAAWNVPACNLKKWSRSDDMVNRVWNFSQRWRYDFARPNGDWSMEFGLVDDKYKTDSFALPIYNAKDATYKAKAKLKTGYGAVANLGSDIWSNSEDDWGASIPFNQSWRPSTGSDGQMTIIDPDTGKMWDLWATAWDGFQNPKNTVASCLTDLNNSQPQSLFFPNGRGGYDTASDLCVGSAILSRGPDGKPADYRTYTGNSPGATGLGLQHYAGIITPEEVAAGEVRHATRLTVANTIFAPDCASMGVTSIDDMRIGSECGTALAPAGMFEKTSANDSPGEFDSRFGNFGNNANERRRNSVPEGLRIALNITDQEIENWLTSRGYTGRKRETARVIAVGMRDYGLIVSDSSGMAGIQAMGAENPETAKKWRDLGLDGDGKNLLFGLFQKEKLYAVEPAVNTCKNGVKSRFYCHASATGYSEDIARQAAVNDPSAPVQPANTPPTVAIAAPTDGQTVVNTATVITAKTSDDGYVAKVQYMNGPNTVATSTAAPDYAASLSSLPVGSYKLTAVATDNKGATATSAPVNVTIKAAATQTPVPVNNQTTQKPSANELSSKPAVVTTSVTPPSVPANLGGYLNFDITRWHYAIVPNWSKSSSTNVKTYVLKRDGIEIYRGPNTSHSDFNIADGKTYTYEVSAFDGTYYSTPKTFKATTKCYWFYCTLQ